MNLESGEFGLETTDVNLSGGLGKLAIVRDYNSHEVAAGATGPLGPQWNVSLGTLAQLEILPDNSALFIGPAGITDFTYEGNEFHSPPGDSDIALTYVAAYESKGSAYLVTDAKQGTTTVFTLPKGAKTWMPTASKSAIATDTTTDEYQTVEPKAGEVIIQPTLELAPHPNATCVREKLERGCRGLEFVYDATTTATGESESAWGGYEHRLKEVIAVAYNPSSKGMGRTAVAAYLYDPQGRLRAEWNPSITPALKTTYGYDAAGHLTAQSSPGQQSWLMHYGTSAGEAGNARLLSVSRLSAEGGVGNLWNGHRLTNSTVPALSTTSPAIGTTLTVNNGTWSTTEIVYGYQWEDCNAAGANCTAIPGATNPSYTPQARDAGDTIVAQVTAYGAAGATTAATTASNVLVMAKPTATKAFGNTGAEAEKVSAPAGIAVESGGSVLVASKANSKIDKYTAAGTYVTSFAPVTFSQPTGVAVSPTTGNFYVSDTGNNRIVEVSPTGTLVTSWGSKGTGLGQFANPTQVVVDGHGDVWVANTADHRVDQFSPSGTYLNTVATTTPAPTLSAPTGVAECAGHMYVVDEARDVVDEYSLEGEYLAQYGVEDHPGAGSGEFNQPVQIACERTGADLYVADKHNNRVQEISATGAFLGSFGTSGTGTAQFAGPTGVAVGVSGAIYVADTENNRLVNWTPTYSTNNPAPPPPAVGVNPTWTMEYNVPLSGTPPGLPQMTREEVLKWAQNDWPSYAGAIFPPDKPMAWPATEYTRATIYYVDAAMRGVNVATSPTSISTREYNEGNEITRALSPDNRTSALKSKETVYDAQQLSTYSYYNSEGALADTDGPMHPVRLAHGKSGSPEETEARNRTEYFYNEGAAPVEAETGEKYGLLTKTIDSAQTSSGELFDARTTTSSYGGQSNLGWKLRRPTSTTIDPNGLALTHTTTYEPETGNTLTTTTPAGTSKDIGIPPVALKSYGSKSEGTFEAPGGAAVDTSNNLWVADTTNNRLEEFSPAGAFMEAIGFGVSDGTAKFEICTSKCKAGLSGHSEGEFNRPLGVTAGSNYIEVADYGNGRVERFTESGSFVSEFGSPGSAAGQLEGPTGVGVDSAGHTWVAENGGNRLSEFGGTSGTSFVQAVGWGVSTGASQFQQCATVCRKGLAGNGTGQLSAPWGVGYEHETMYVADTGNSRVAAFKEAGTPAGTITGPVGELKEPLYVAGNPTDSGIFVTDGANNRVAEFSASGEVHYNFASGSGTGLAQLSKPTGIAVSEYGGPISIVDSGNDRISVWQASNRGNQGAHTTKTAYYTAGTNKEVATCGGHIEWAGLPCETTPAEQPGTGSYPERPVSTVEYNMWDEAELTTETFGKLMRQRKATFDTAGRPKTEQETSTADEPLPKISDTYNNTSGALETETNGSKTITTIYNTLGQLEAYTDAEGAKATYTYDISGRITSLSDASEEGKGKQTYTYDPSSGYMIKLEDSAAGAFGATYDASGRIATDTFPNGMTAFYTYDSAGAATSIEYKKLTHCTEEHEKCVWYKDAFVPYIHGELAKQASTLAEEPSYTYDADGRLTEVQEVPAGEGCKTRSYSYDEEGNRLSLTKRAPTAEGKCATEGGETSFHLYDSANHPIDEGVTYDAFGDATRLPEHAGEPELNTTFYVDGQTATQSQSGENITYKLDPEDRTLETNSTGTTSSTAISHYDGPGAGVTWTSEPEGRWTRNIPGINGELAAIETNAKAPVLQIHDLRGDTVGTASLSETATGLETKYNSTEFGVPGSASQPPKYAWLGSGGIASELVSGTVDAGGVSYVPQIARTLQSQPTVLPVPTENAGEYAALDPSWVGESAASAAALENSEMWAAQHAAEAAAVVGAAPKPECNEEVEGCLPDPEHGENPWRCEGFASWGKADPEGTLMTFGHWRCHNGWPAAIEQELFLVWVGGGREVRTGHAKKYWYFPNESESNWEADFECLEEETYKLVVWTRTINEWNHQTNWVGERADGRTASCGQGEIEIEVPEGL